MDKLFSKKKGGQKSIILIGRAKWDSLYAIIPGPAHFAELEC